MSFSQFFIQRPIFAAVLSLIILIGGAISLFQLPISEYPEVVPPTVVVRAQLPRRQPQGDRRNRRRPLEQAINGVENMIYMSSQSTADGKMTLTVTLALGTNLDTAQVQVQNRVTRTLPKLPEEVQRIGITVDKASPDLTMVVHLLSPDDRYDMLYLSNYALLNVKDELCASRWCRRRAALRSRRIFAARLARSHQGREPRPDARPTWCVRSASRTARLRAGSLGAPPSPGDNSFQLSINTQGRLVTEEEFSNIVIHVGDNGEITRLRDIARIELGSDQYALRSLLNNKPADRDPGLPAPGLQRHRHLRRRAWRRWRS